MRTSQTMTSGTNVPIWRATAPSTTPAGRWRGPTLPPGSAGQTAQLDGTSKAPAAVGGDRVGEPAEPSPRFIRTWPAVGAARELGPPLRFGLDAAARAARPVRRPRRGTRRRRRRRGRTSARRRSPAGSAAATAARSRELRRPARQHHADLRLDQPDAERAARADALVGAEQQQRAGRDRVARSTRRPPAPPIRTSG